jgi:hypothetical protein
MFESNVVCRSQQKMDMLRHENEGVQLIAVFSAISVHGFEEEASIVLDDEESTALPSRESYKVSSGRGYESSRLQKLTSAAGSRAVCLG